jgi:hypothetical protein
MEPDESQLLQLVTQFAFQVTRLGVGVVMVPARQCDDVSVTL